MQIGLTNKKTQRHDKQLPYGDLDHSANPAGCADPMTVGQKNHAGFGWRLVDWCEYNPF